MYRKNQIINTLEQPLKEKRFKISEVVKSLSIISAFKGMGETRCGEGDDRELDVIEGFKFMSFVLL